MKYWIITTKSNSLKKRNISLTGIPEESNIRRILFLEAPPNPAGAFSGVWWIMSFDGNGEQIEDHKGRGVGNAEFFYNEKEEAEKWLSELEARTGIKSEYIKKKTPAISIHGLINRFRKN